MMRVSGTDNHKPHESHKLIILGFNSQIRIQKTLNICVANCYAYHKKCVDNRRKWFQSLKEKDPCLRCGQKYPYYVMDWHHRNPCEKSFGLGQQSFRKSRKLLLEEIAKCDLLCANCHRIVEYEAP